MSLHGWHNPTNGRRYQAVLGPDLFGDWILWRGWCGADGRRGGMRRDVFTWEEDGLRALVRVKRRRQARGYVENAPVERPGEAGRPRNGRAARREELIPGGL